MGAGKWGAVYPGFSRPWEAPSTPRAPFQQGLGIILCPHFSPEPAAGSPGPVGEFSLCKERSYEVGMGEGSLVFPSFGTRLSLALPSQIFTRPRWGLRTHHRGGLPLLPGTLPGPGRWTVREFVPHARTTTQGPQSFRTSRSPQNVSQHHWARRQETGIPRS